MVETVRYSGLDIHCAKCVSARLVPVVYGMQVPRRDLELSLEGKIVLRAAICNGTRSPLWACAECHALIELPMASPEGYRKLLSAYGECLREIHSRYQPLSNEERERLVCRMKMRKLVAQLSTEDANEFEIVPSEAGAVVRTAGTNREHLRCSSEAWQKVLAYCVTSPVIKIQDGTSWRIAVQEVAGVKRVTLSRANSLAS